MTSFIEHCKANASVRTLFSTKRKMTSSAVENTTRKRPKRMVSSEESYAVDPKDEYLRQLKVTKQYWKLSNGTYIVTDCDRMNGVLQREKYCVLEKNMVFYDCNRTHNVALLSCNCEDGVIQQRRLMKTNSVITEAFHRFVEIEKSKYCLHAATVDRLCHVESNGVLQCHINGAVVEHLEDIPLLAAITMEEVHLVHLKKTVDGKRLACMTCRYDTRACEYVKVYKAWLEETDKPTPESESTGPRTSNFSYVSYKKVPYPLNAELKNVYDKHESGQLPLPRQLIPLIPDEPLDVCQHGNAWNAGDPVQNNWCIGDAIIYKENSTISTVNTDGVSEKITVYYRPSNGECSCRLFYDGKEDLLFNLNNHDMVHYGLLHSYLHLMLEGRNPLAAFHRAYAQKHSTLSTTAHLPLHKLRLAWNGFARLLDVDFNEAFNCNSCGTTPDTVVCDGTGIGLQKELLQCFREDDEVGHLPPIIGSKHADRVFIPNAQARKLLLQFAGLNPNSKHERNLPPVPLSPEQYQQLITLLRKHNHLSSLVDVIQRISNNGTQLLAEENYRSLLQDLSRNSPASSLLQNSSTPVRTRHILKEMVIKGLNIFHSQHRDKLQLLKKDAPIITDFIEAISTDGRLPHDARCLIKVILKRCKVEAPMTTNSHHYLPPHQTELFKTLDFFPNLPKIHGAGNYQSDCRTEDRACRGLDTCNKFYKGHPSLSPGLFTMYCKHKVCLGFQVMKRHESPALPFQIIKQRFERAPNIIIYDNACKLHQYCLNREPEFFKDTMFLVDRLHWCNHTGCSNGYNMDRYTGNKDITNLNSQICEQTNAAISRIKAQVSYMLPDNFIFHAALFLGLANKKVKGLLSV